MTGCFGMKVFFVCLQSMSESDGKQSVYGASCHTAGHICVLYFNSSPIVIVCAHYSCHVTQKGDAQTHVLCQFALLCPKTCDTAKIINRLFSE
jgi:hypothetical protein